MFKVVFTIFFIIHIVWWPIHFIFLELTKGADSYLLGAIMFWPLGWYLTYVWLEKISNADPSGNWGDEWGKFFHGFGFMLSPVITIMTYAWIFLSF